jgi:hypothetical protein
LDIGEYDSDVQATFKNCNGFICTRRFDDLKSLAFNRISNSSSTIRMTARFASEIIGLFFFSTKRAPPLHSDLYVGSRTHLFEPFEVGGVGSDGCDFADHPEISNSACSAGIAVGAGLIDRAR